MKYEALYWDGRHYDLFNSFTSDIPFYLDEARKANGPILEIASGTGRITIPLAKAGIEITGLDLTLPLIDIAKKKAESAHVQISWIHGDCRTFHLGKKFNLIFMGFNSMLHLYQRTDIEAFLQKVKEHLTPKGHLVFDVFNPSISHLASRNPSERTLIKTYTDPDGRGTISVEETGSYDDVHQVIRVKWYYSINSKKDIKVDELNLRCFFPQELDSLLHYNGFTILEKYGNYDRKTFSSGDPKQVFVCKMT